MMNKSLMALIRCPRCRTPGPEPSGEPPRELTCRSCGLTVPVDLGIPRLVDRSGSYAASFGRQWNRFDVARPEEDDATFRVKTGVSPCRPGGPTGARRRLRRRPLCPFDRFVRGRVVGVDLSDAVTKAAALCAQMPEVLIIQADLLDLPLADRVFDFVYSIGVLHHSPDPRRAFPKLRAR